MVDRVPPGEEHKAQEHYEKLSAIARARTLNVFEALDPIRKGTIIRLLVYAGSLMDPEQKKAEPEKPAKGDASGTIRVWLGTAVPSHHNFSSGRPLRQRHQGGHLQREATPRSVGASHGGRAEAPGEDHA